jgi:ubiquinone biosynthesis protein
MIRQMGRYRQITGILVKYGLGALIAPLLPGRQAAERPDGADPLYRRIRLALEELGPTFIKFGQILSTRREVLPGRLIEELSLLTDTVAPLPFETVRPTIEERCGPIATAFASFDEKPVAAASLAQVHRAVLKDGTVVAVKVQRPGIRRVIEDDIEIMEYLARQIERRRPDLAVYNPTGLVQEFAAQIRRELDFVQEGKNAGALARNLRESPGVVIPRIYPAYSGPLVLTMDYIDGVRVDDAAGIRAMGISPEDVTDTLLAAYLKQVFEDGFFHADPHPGNLLVTETGALAFVDFGTVGILRPERRDAFLRLVAGIVDEDTDAIVGAYRDLGIVIPDRAADLFKDEIYATLMGPGSYGIGEVDIAGVMEEIPATLRRYHLKVPLPMMQVIKVLLFLMAICRDLDESFNFTARAGPGIRAIRRRQVFSMEGADALAKAVGQQVRDAAEIPGAVNAALRKLSAGQISLAVGSPELDALGGSIRYAANVALVGMVAAAFVLGSALVILSSEPRASPGLCSMVSSLTLSGFLVAVLIAVAAAYAALKRR